MALGPIFFDMKYNFNKLIGNFLIAISLVGLFSIYFPILMLFLPSTTTQEITFSQDEYRVEIPKIKAIARIVTEVDPWRREVYEKALESGVAHAQGTSLPGEVGRSYLFAHSTLPPWKMTRTNTPFLFLNRLAIGDTIKVMKRERVFEYRVYDLKVVSPNETKYIREKVDRSEIILQTCTPLGTSLMRLLVFAVMNDNMSITTSSLHP